MRAPLSLWIACLATAALTVSAFAGKHADEKTVFVTGSLIPKRIKLKPIGTPTVSPVRIIDRREIDQTGRQTTQGALTTADPSVRAVGH